MRKRQQADLSRAAKIGVAATGYGRMSAYAPFADISGLTGSPRPHRLRAIRGADHGIIGQSAPDVPGCISTSEDGLLAHRLVAVHHIPVFTFGHSTLIDLLSWTVALALGAKIVATLIFLTVGKDVRDQPGWGSFLWWVTKVAPVIAVPCAIWIAWDQQLMDLLWMFLALMLFVIIAVPLKIRQRRTRLANHTAASSIA